MTASQPAGEGRGSGGIRGTRSWHAGFSVPPCWPAPESIRARGDIRVPVLLVKAEWDADTPSYMALALFSKLVNVPFKKYVELGEGTRMVLLEKNRLMLFREVQLFLDEPLRTAK